MGLKKVHPIVLLLGLVVSCGDGAAPPAPGACASRTDCGAGESCVDGRCAATVDAGYDAGTLEDAGTMDDASTLADAALGDAGGPVDSGTTSDAGAVTDDAGLLNPCLTAGGRCVRLSCPIGTVSAAYSCGGGLRTMCCVPVVPAPTCTGVGTRSEGWVRADGTRICFARCGGAAATCQNIGSRSEGWYAAPVSAACAGAISAGLVEFAACAP